MAWKRGMWPDDNQIFKAPGLVPSCLRKSCPAPKIIIPPRVFGPVTESRSGVPVLGRIPGVGLLFSSREVTSVNTETIVVITPRVIGESSGPWNTEPQSEIEKLDRRLQQRANDIDDEMSQSFFEADPVGGTDRLAESN